MSTVQRPSVQAWSFVRFGPFPRFARALLVCSRSTSIVVVVAIFEQNLVRGGSSASDEFASDLRARIVRLFEDRE